MLKFVLCIVMLFASTQSVGDIFSLRNLYLVHKKFGENSRNVLIDTNGLENRELDREISLFWNVDMFKKVMYWDNQILSYTDRYKDSGETDQFRLVGWNFQIGLRLTNFLDIGYDHFSKHLLDAKYPNVRFPVEDSLFIRLDFYERDDRGGLVEF